MFRVLLLLTIAMNLGSSASLRADDSANVIRGTITIVERGSDEKTRRSNAVVFLDPVGTIPAYESPSRNPQVSQRSRRFRPAVLPIMAGTSVDFPNDDRVFHNVFSLSEIKPFDLGAYEKGESKTVTFDKPGLAKVYCNIHPDMVLHVLVLNNPFFVTTNAAGEFELPSVPDGSYKLRVWHEFGDEVERSISVAGGQTLEYEITLQETISRLPHKNKFGRPYREKY